MNTDEAAAAVPHVVDTIRLHGCQTPIVGVTIVAAPGPLSCDHCNVSVLDGAPESLVARFCDLLLSMRYDDPVARPLLDLEGLKQWRPGRTNGYATLARSCDRFRWIDRFVQSMQP